MYCNMHLLKSNQGYNAILLFHELSSEAINQVIPYLKKFKNLLVVNSRYCVAIWLKNKFAMDFNSVAQ